MINIEEIQDYKKIKFLHEKLEDEIVDLKMKLDTEKHQLTKKLKRERYEIIKALKSKLKNLKENDNDEIIAIKREIEEKRKELYLKRDKELISFEETKAPERERLEKLEDDYQQISKIIDGVNEQRNNRTNEEHLFLITKGLEELGQEDYSIRLFNKKFTYVGIGSHSDFPHYLSTEIEGVVAIVKNGMDVSEIPEEVISYPDENEEFYKSGEFILFRKLNKPIEESLDFFEKKTYITESLPGMSDELISIVNDKLYAEYQNSLISKKIKVNN